MTIKPRKTSELKNQRKEEGARQYHHDFPHVQENGSSWIPVLLFFGLELLHQLGLQLASLPCGSWDLSASRIVYAHTHTHTHTQPIGSIFLENPAKGSLGATCCLVTKTCSPLCDPWTIACQAPLSVGFLRQEYWSGLLGTT